MICFVKSLRKRTAPKGDFWLAGQFGRNAHIERDRAIAAWSEHLGRQSAELWLAARAGEARGR
jgi:hypothetical protein